MITLDRLKYFIEVATLEHVGHAAKNLHISPSVISAAISTLEEEFKCELFIREKNRLKLNDKGHVLLEQAKSLIEKTNQLYTDVAGGNSQMKGHYRFGGSHFLVNQFLIPSFLDLHKKHPSVTCEFLSSDTGIAIANVLSGALDAALVFRSSFQYDMDEQILSEGHFQIAVKKKHPLLNLTKNKKIESLNELPSITFKTAVGPNYVESHPVFKEFGITPKHTFFYDDDKTAIQLLESTNGWAFLPEMMIEKYSNKIEKVTISKDWKAPVVVSLIRNKNKTACRLTSLLRDELVQNI
jgi:DNA-binding transcriptional LysR family regulator